jgi:hypothetical protein
LNAQTSLLLLTNGATWEYLADGTAPPPNWNKTPWAPSTWPTGPGPLGYGRGDEATVVHAGSGEGPLTTYFRLALVVTNESPFQSVTLRLVRDDAAVVYVNGSEVLRNNLPGGLLTSTTSALRPIDGAEELIPQQSGVWPYFFVEGTNVIAVELHQHVDSQQDGRFAMELLANLPVSYPVVTLQAPAQGDVFNPGPVRFRASASDADGHITYVQYFVDGAMVGSVNSPPFDFIWLTAVAGRHIVYARAIDDSWRYTDTNPIHIQIGDAGASRLVRGPYLQNGTTNSAVIRWRTDWFIDSRIQFGTAPGDLSRHVEELAPVIEHEVVVTNLQANTRYYYSIGSREGVLSSGQDHTFTTLPMQPKPTRIWALGDSGTANANASAVLNAYLHWGAGRETDVWLMLGDNAYELGSDDEYQKAVFEMYPALLRRTFLWPTLGNHDASVPGYPGEFPFLDIFTLPTKGEAGGVASGTEKYYSFDYGNIHFVCLDSMSSPRGEGSPMRVWLEEDLQSTSGDWIIAYWHHPPYSWGTHNSDTDWDLAGMREQIVPVLERYGVDLVLCGHSHNYERSWFINGHHGHSSTFAASMVKQPGFGRESQEGAYQKPAGGQGANQGAVYVVCGCSGEGGYFEYPRHPAMALNLSGFGSMVLDVDGLKVTVQFLDQFGQTRDTFTIRKDRPTNEPLPKLSITRAGQQLELGWPTSLFPYHLQTSPGNSSHWLWTPLNLPTNVVRRQFRVRVPVESSNQFFRLRSGAN